MSEKRETIAADSYEALYPYLRQVTSCASAGMQGILFSNYPWNQADYLPDGAVRCSDWPDVVDYLEGRG